MENLTVSSGQQSNDMNDLVISYLCSNDTEEMPDRIYSSMLRYIAILENECPELTCEEWMCIIESLYGSCRNTTDTSTDIATWLSSAVESGDAWYGLSKKWKVDIEALTSKLKGYSYTQQCAIIEIVNRWWDGLDNSEEKQKARLISSGAKIKQ